MKRLLILISLLCCFHAYGQTAVTNANFSCVTSAATCAVTVTGAVAAGDVLGTCVTYESASVTITSMADSLSQSYSAIPSLTDRSDPTDPVRGGCRDKVNSTSGTSPVMTVTLSSAPGGTWIVWGFHISGVAVAPHDGASSNCLATGCSPTSTGTANAQFSGGTFTTTQPNAIILGLGSLDNGPLSHGTSFTQLQADSFGGGPFSMLESRTVSSTNTYSGAFSSATANDDAIAFGWAYDSSTQPGGGPPPGQMPMSR